MSVAIAKDFLKRICQDEQLRRLCRQFTVQELQQAACSESIFLREASPSGIGSPCEMADTPYTD